ncbi:histidinol-phosphate aminotransferase [Mesobacillus campisalis]|uniref:Histidinol-phosphate aminotransferase n=1 Tax=Mesobacillus campisalis TaxID=1408103 RepID=A0A0M2SYA7_9BACI|nr:histidinol-phosphate transaminase [Mesobacillus campisalis]KKK37600.1 histidinol-phosphate aminotransferase [Mesobacillus campisalis]
MKWKKQILGLKPYQPGRTIQEVKQQYGLKQVTKLASNENPFGCSQAAADAIANHSASLALYPDGYASELRQAVGGHLEIKPEQLIFGNGSDEIIQIISRSLLQPGVNTVMAAPTFPQYKHNAILEGSEIREVPLKGGYHDLEAMAEAVDENTAVVWLCTPNNPTGTYISSQDLSEFLQKMPADVLVVLDEAYYEYVEAEDYHDSLSLIKEYKNLIVLRTFSKIYGLASLRVGYGVADENLIRTLDPAREPFNVNTLAHAAAIAAIKDQEFLKRCKKANQEGLRQFYTFCEEHQLDYYPSSGNFILIDFACDANEVFQFLLERGFIVRSGAALGFPTSVRVTVGSMEQNAGVIECMKEFLAARAALS